uniref:Uncharacterized protein n=1 Tax=Trichogramma kaykai TaxID=54128 RepID=A0ABD2WIA8_9HYME
MQYACLQCRIHDGRPNLTRSFSRSRKRATLQALAVHAVWAVVCAIDAEALDAQCIHKGLARRLDALLQASSPLSERDIPAD